MKIKILFFFTLLFITEANSQDIIVLDCKTKKTLSYVTIFNIKNKIGFYTNEKGSFSLADLKSDSLYISHISYKTLNLKTSEIKDTIFLNPNLEILDEINIISGKSKEKTIGYIKKTKTLSWNIKEKTELATLINYKKKYKSAYIKKIYLPIGKLQLHLIDNKIKESYPNFKSIFRIHIYSNSNGSPGVEILDKPLVIECNEKTLDIIEINILEKFIKLPQNGVFIGVEMIGELDNKRNLLDKKGKLILPSFLFTRKKKNNILSETFIKTIIDNGKWRSTKKHNKSISNFSKYNMAISLELSIYD
jgi:hypothetical protein